MQLHSFQSNSVGEIISDLLKSYHLILTVSFLALFEFILRYLSQSQFMLQIAVTGSSVPVYSTIICPIPGRLCPMDYVGEMVCGKMGNEYRLFRSKCHQCAHSCREVVRGGEYYKTIKDKTRCRGKRSLMMNRI